MSDSVKKALSLMYKEEITSERAEQILVKEMTKEQLAEYIVEAFNRGWITPFNVGLNSDGEIV